MSRPEIGRQTVLGHAHLIEGFQHPANTSGRVGFPIGRAVTIVSELVHGSVLADIISPVSHVICLEFLCPFDVSHAPALGLVLYITVFLPGHRHRDPLFFH